MRLRRGLLFGLTAATVFAQEFPVVEIDKAAIRMAVEEAKQSAQAAVMAQKAQIAEDVLVAKQTMKMDMAKRFDSMFITNDAFDKAFAMRPFFQKGGGGPLTEEEELKLIAIDGLMDADPERAIPLVDKVVQNQQASQRLRLRALQALGRNDSTRAREVVVRIAKDGSNPELQSRALQMLGSRESTQNRQLLNEVYASAANADVKKQVLRSWAGMGAKDQLVNVAKSDPSPEVRASAINHLGGMRANAELAALYGSEPSNDVKERVIRALGGSGDWQQLLQIAKTEKNEDLRNRAIQSAGSIRASGVADALTEMYSASTDVSTRNAILRALSHQGNAKQLIAVARKETDPELKRSALQQLSRMKGDDVTAYLMELLNK